MYRDKKLCPTHSHCGISCARLAEGRDQRTYNWWFMNSTLCIKIKKPAWVRWKAVAPARTEHRVWLLSDTDPRSSCESKNRPTQLESIMRNGNLPRLLWPVTFECLKISKNGAHGQESARNFTQEWHLASNPLGKFWKITPCTRSHIHCHLIIALAKVSCIWAAGTGPLAQTLLTWRE